MFLGHFGLAYASKRIAPTVSLGTTFFAAQLADLMWPVLLLTGSETVVIDRDAPPQLALDFTSYPYSHSLAMLMVFGVLVGAIHFGVKRRIADAIVVALLVPSHWVLDWIVHVPDLPLAPDTAARYGLGAWRSLPLTLGLELVLFGGGYFIYTTVTKARDRIGTRASIGLVAFLVVAYAASYGGAPPSVTALASMALLLWILVPWAAWADRHRSPST
jgi:hypothetical protein